MLLILSALAPLAMPLGPAGAQTSLQVEVHPPRTFFSRRPRNYSVIPVSQAVEPSKADATPQQQQPIQKSQNAIYRTVCVRLCDGYFWPISENAEPSQFQRDAEVCSASCTSDTELFYHPRGVRHNPSMLGLSGKRYAELATAFAYRKSYSAACACKPAPWSAAELDRHQIYAAEDERREAERKRMAIATPPPADPAAVARDLGPSQQDALAAANQSLAAREAGSEVLASAQTDAAQAVPATQQPQQATAPTATAPVRRSVQYAARYATIQRRGAQRGLFSW
ncbi:MAG: DUF2865 domain-containing protein [Hyphomicrobium sp.]